MNHKKNRLLRSAAFAFAILLISGCTENIEYPEGVDTLPTFSATGTVQTIYDTQAHTLEAPTSAVTTTVTTTIPEIFIDSQSTVSETEETTVVCETEITTSAPLSLDDVPVVGISEYYENTIPVTTAITTESRPVTLISTEGYDSSSETASESLPVYTGSGEGTESVTSETSSDTGLSAADVSGAKPDDRLTDGRKSRYTGRNIISHPYSYYTLDSKHKTLYDKLVSSMFNYDDYVEFTASEGYTFDDLFNTYQLLYNDENRLFFISSTLEYITDSNGNVTKLNLAYLYDKDKIQSMQKEIDEETEKILSQITPEMSDYEIVKLFHDYIIVNCTYDDKAERPNNIYGALVDKRALCQAYSQSFTYLCSLVGIDSFIVLGVANEPHMWNIVKMDNDYYHIDLTWDDPDRARNPDSIRYDYFGLTDERIRQLRQFDDYDYEIPKAEGTKYQYYYYNDLVAGSLKEAKQILEAEIIKASQEKRSTVQFMCIDDDSYKAITDVLFGNSNENIISVLNSVKDRIPNQYNTESVYHNSNTSTRTVKVFLDYLD